MIGQNAMDLYLPDTIVDLKSTSLQIISNKIKWNIKSEHILIFINNICEKM